MTDPPVSSLLNTTCDGFLNGRVLVRQPEAGFRSGLDAVFLAAACSAEPGDHILDAGCGAGAASLCLLARVQGALATGVEIDPAMAALARENAEANSAAGRFKVISADVRAAWRELETAGLHLEDFDHAIANPPFYIHGRSRQAKNPNNARARAMDEGALDEWLRFMAAAVKPAGTCTIIHVAEALPQLLNALEGRFGDMRVSPLYPSVSAPAIRVIVRGKKGSRAPISIRPGIVLHNPDGSPTDAAEAILREGNGLN